MFVSFFHYEIKKYFILFSTGRRTCLGEQLSRQEMFLFFTNILKSFHIKPTDGAQLCDDPELKMLILKPKKYKVCFVPRH